MIVTDDEELADQIRLLRSHGMTTLTWDRHRGHANAYDVAVQGFNYRLDELRSAIGLVQLRRLRERNAARARVAACYRAELDGVRGIRMPFPPDPDVISAHHLAVILVPPDRSREEIRAYLAAHGIQTSVHYPPIHQFSAYRALGPARSLPATDAVASRLLTLPLYPHMTDADVEAVTSGVINAI
jgi:dTDP-4-amino-4,6-dideoxygalactose transaminase